MGDAPEMLGSRGGLFFDGDCSLCRRLAGIVAPSLRRRGVRVVPLQTPGVAALLDVPPERLLDELRMVTPAGDRVSGVNAVLAACREVPWLRGVPLLARVPGAQRLLRAGYRRVARARRCARPG